MLYTSRYSNPELKTGKYVAVRISLGTPKWPLGYEIAGEIKDLMPWGMLNKYSHEEFIHRYRERLDKIGVNRIQRELSRFSGEKPVVLLCYEDVRKPGEWCHRTHFAEWWHDRTGEIVEELPDPSGQKPVPDRQAARTLGPMNKAMAKAKERIRSNQAEAIQLSMF